VVVRYERESVCVECCDAITDYAVVGYLSASRDYEGRRCRRKSVGGGGEGRSDGGSGRRAWARADSWGIGLSKTEDNVRAMEEHILRLDKIRGILVY
jgi:hypothetical protein